MVCCYFCTFPTQDADCGVSALLLNLHKRGASKARQWHQNMGDTVERGMGHIKARDGQLDCLKLLFSWDWPVAPELIRDNQASAFPTKHVREAGEREQCQGINLKPVQVG